VKDFPWLQIGGGERNGWRGYVAEDPEWGKKIVVGDRSGSDTNCNYLTPNSVDRFQIQGNLGF
jgi:hypothetical protein